MEDFLSPHRSSSSSSILSARVWLKVASSEVVAVAVGSVPADGSVVVADVECAR
jgi:hypothetical protein